MKSDIKGCSTCEPGQEVFEYYNYPTSYGDVQKVQYDYRTPDGILFSCIGRSLEECRERRDAWLFRIRVAQNQKIIHN